MPNFGGTERGIQKKYRICIGCGLPANIKPNSYCRNCQHETRGHNRKRYKYV